MARGARAGTAEMLDALDERLRRAGMVALTAACVALGAALLR